MAHSPSICEIAPNRFAITWFGGSYEKSPDTSIWLAISDENGTWSPPKEIANGIDEKTLVRYPTWNPVITKFPDGKLVLFYKVGSSPRDWWGEYTLSEDLGKTWSKPVKLPQNFIGPVRTKPLFYNDNTVIYPSSIEETSRGGWGVRFERSNTRLQEWSFTSPQKTYTNFFLFSTGINIIQPALLQMDKEKLAALCRSRNGYIYKLESNDGGISWSTPEPTSLENPNSSIDAVKLEDSSILLANNPDKKYRNKLAIHHSANLKDWNQILILENDENSKYSAFAYPSMIISQSKEIHLVYSVNKRFIKHLVIEIES